MFLNNPRTALITGSSSGIGYELARLFAKDLYNLVIVARDRARLDRIASDFQNEFGVKVKVLAKDLSHYSASREIFSELKQESIKVDVLVNNAGFGTYGFFAETSLQNELEMMQVNMVSLTELTKLFLPNMIQKKSGKIMNVASTAAFEPGPLMAVYYATKAYVLSFSEALANELKGTGVTVTALCPGITRSGFQKRAEMESSRLAQRWLMSAEKVAKIGYRGLMRNKTVVIPGLRHKALAFIVRFFPRNFVTQAVRRVQESVKHKY